jgi:hypothetical protein
MADVVVGVVVAVEEETIIFQREFRACVFLFACLSRWKMIHDAPSCEKRESHLDCSSSDWQLLLRKIVCVEFLEVSSELGR